MTDYKVPRFLHPIPATWFITGASSGIGFALAQGAAGRGDNVVALARDVTRVAPLVEQHGSRVIAVPADVRRPADIGAAVSRAVDAFGRIDIVANNAGYGLFGAVEESTDEQARGIFDTNVFGVLNVLRAVLPILRRQRRGHILQGSSYFGHVGHAGVGLISATKFAVEGLTDALVAEVAPLGIKVTLVEPGPTATPFVANLELAATLTDYDRTVRKVQKAMGELTPENLDSSDDVAAEILQIAGTENPPLRLATGTGGVAAIRAALQGKLDELDAREAKTRAAEPALVP